MGDVKLYALPKTLNRVSNKLDVWQRSCPRFLIKKNQLEVFCIVSGFLLIVAQSFCVFPLRDLPN